ncbi:MAG: hypothetical protein Rhob2KO_35780 [Rhodopirellula baltica]
MRRIGNRNRISIDEHPAIVIGGDDLPRTGKQPFDVNTALTLHYNQRLLTFV